MFASRFVGSERSAWSVVVHGGAGRVPEARRDAHARGCRDAVEVAARLLDAGAASVDAVEAAVRALEDDPIYNAGTGACLNERGEIEHDAAIMEGASLRAGAVCCVPGLRDPIRLARAVMDDGRHVFLAGEGALAFARAHGFEEVPLEVLVTPAARANFERVRARRGHVSWAGGTVGAVARDSRGTVAAATSTGGTVNKRVGRVGDSPVLGAGTYADDEAGAVSATGMGEGILRVAMASQVIEAMRAGHDARDACLAATVRLVERLGATAGLIAVDRDGALGVARSTETMSFGARWRGDGGGVFGA